MPCDLYCGMINHYNSVLCSCCVHPQEFCHLFAMPFSVVVSCGQPDAPGNGRVNTSTGNVGDVARYSCDSGYTLSGTAERTCQADGQWSGRVSTCKGEIMQCIEINCAVLPVSISIFNLFCVLVQNVVL